MSKVFPNNLVTAEIIQKSLQKLIDAKELAKKDASDPLLTLGKIVNNMLKIKIPAYSDYRPPSSRDKTSENPTKTTSKNGRESNQNGSSTNAPRDRHSNNPKHSSNDTLDIKQRATEQK